MWGFKRHLVAAVVATGLLGMFPAALSAGPDGASGRGGLTNPFFVLNNGTRDAAHPTADSQAAMARELGYAGMAYSGADGLPAMLEALDRHRLKLFAVYLGANIDPGEPKYDPKLNDVIRSLKGRDTVVWIYIRSKKHKPSSVAGDPRAVEIIREIAEKARASGLRVALYPHVGLWMERVEDAVRLAKKVDRKNVGVTFNLCHWLILDDEATLKSRLALALPYLFVVTINGSSRDVSVSSRAGWVQTLDRGTFNVYAFLETLNASGYRGPVGLQCWSIKGDAHDNLKRSMAAWRAFSAAIAAGAPLLGGVASVSITPPLEWGVPLGGYGERMSKPAERVHDLVKAKALVLARGDRRIAIVTVDIVGLPGSVKHFLLQKLQADGFSAENVLLLASHTHAGVEMAALNHRNTLKNPAIGIFSQRLLDFHVDRLAEVIRKAAADLVPIKAGSAVGRAPGCSANRRGDKTVDDAVTVLRIDRAAGGPLAVLVNFTAHPTFMDAKDMWVSGGWPGYMQREVEALVGEGVTCMYYNGAEGDQSPRLPPAGPRTAGSDYERAELLGRHVALVAAETYRTIHPTVPKRFGFALRRVKLPAAQVHPKFMETGGAEYGFDDATLDKILHEISPRETAVQAVRLDDWVAASVPGEMIVGLGLRIKEALHSAGAKCPTIGGLGNEWISYILTADEYAQGGYEASVSFYGPTLGETITQNAIRVGREVLAMP